MGPDKNHVSDVTWQVYWAGILRQLLREGRKKKEEKWEQEEVSSNGATAHVQKHTTEAVTHAQGTCDRSNTVASWAARDDVSGHQVPQKLAVKMPHCREITFSCPWMCLIANNCHSEIISNSY